MAITEPRPGRMARIDFIEAPLKLVHIPLHHYARYVQPLLQILFPLAEPSHQNGSKPAGWQSPSMGTVIWMNQHHFLNLSITPLECSLFCSSALADEYFGAPAQQGWVEMSKDEFIAISMEGDGLDASQRVLELTAPLAMAGISIFFFTTYFSDYVLVPTASRDSVVEALESRGFVFDNHPHDDPAHSSGHSPHHHHHRRMTNSTGSVPDYLPPTIDELQSRNVALLKRYRIKPTIQRGLRLIHCAGRSDAAGAADLQIGLVRCLAHPPRFLSVTLTGTEPASLLLEPNRAEAAFGGASGAAAGLARAAGDVLIPITLDLGRLSLENSGIVCGLAGKLAGVSTAGSADEGSSGGGHAPPRIEMSYLSTARGAAVLVGEEEVETALLALRTAEDGQGMEIVG